MNETTIFTSALVAFILGFILLLGYSDSNTTKCITAAIEKGYTAVEIQAICK
jgi:hypothetical protein